MSQITYLKTKLGSQVTQNFPPIYNKLIEKINDPLFNRADFVINLIKKLHDNEDGNRLRLSDSTEFLTILLRNISGTDISLLEKMKMMELINYLFPQPQIYTAEQVEFIIKKLVNSDCNLREAIADLPDLNLNREFRLIVEGREYYASKDLLLSYSNYFKSWMRRNKSEGALEIGLMGVQPKAIKKFLDCLHGQKFVPDDFDDEMLVLSNFFELENPWLDIQCLRSCARKIRAEKIEALDLYKYLHERAPNIFKNYLEGGLNHLLSNIKYW